LQKLMLAGNRLRYLPSGMADARQLELLRLSANQFAHLPGWLTELPRLSWLALSGNPLGWQRAEPAPLGTVSWSQLRMDGLLGEGASGHIYRVHPAGGANALALKLFKGAVTSDGLPEHELAASLAAGQHPGLCTPSAQLADHPHGARGLLLPLIPPSHAVLAGPPSLDSCTRDVYPTGLRIAAPLVLRLAQAIAEAVAHLHRRGVMHGDLYAHNILWNPLNADALLSDFGGATLLPLDRPATVRALQALEVRAFGCLLDELLALVEPRFGQAPALGAITRLAQECLSDTPAARPTMAEVAQALKAWSETD
jgi:serine/threonine protein kinase